MTRTTVRSPVDGLVKEIYLKSIGSVVKSGDDIMEIVPDDKTMIVEGRMLPSDMAFLRVGLPAIIKISAYDFSRFGVLKGRLKHISADTIQDEKGHSFYKVLIHIDFSEVNDNKMELLPDMVATVEVITGQKSLLSYIINSITKVRHNAFSER